MPTPATIAELQLRLEGDLDLGHKFVHGLANETVQTSTAVLPTLAGIAASALPSAPSMITTLTVPEYISTHLGELLVNAFTATPVLTSTDAEWDSYNGGIRLLREGVYTVEVTVNVQSVDAQLEPVEWFAGGATNLSTRLMPSSSVVPPSMSYSVHHQNAGTIDASMSSVRFSDKYVVRFDGTPYTDLVNLEIGCANHSSDNGAGSAIQAVYTAVVTVTRIGTSIVI